MKTRYILVKNTTTKGTQYLVQLIIRGKSCYLGRFSDYLVAARLADASYYHAVVGGYLPRLTVDKLTKDHFNDWETARLYVEGGPEKAPAADPKLLTMLATLPTKSVKIPKPSLEELVMAFDHRVECMEESNAALLAALAELTDRFDVHISRHTNPDYIPAPPQAGFGEFPVTPMVFAGTPLLPLRKFQPEPNGVFCADDSSSSATKN